MQTNPSFDCLSVRHLTDGAFFVILLNALAQFKAWCYTYGEFERIDARGAKNEKIIILCRCCHLFWSTVSVAAKLLLNAYNNFQVLWVSAFFAAAFLLVLNIATGNIKTLKNYKWKDYITTVLIGLPGSFFYYVFFYAGADKMLASQAFIVNYLWPIMSVVFACIILKEKMTMQKAIAIALSFLGVVVVMWKDLFAFDSTMLSGAGLCAAGAVSYGVFTALNQKYQYDKRISMMLNFFVTFILTGIINAVRRDLFVPDMAATLGFAWNGILTMGIATTAWAIALECGETAKISNLAYITPFLSLVWTWLILKEQLHINFVLGLMIIVLGILIQNRNKSLVKK